MVLSGARGRRLFPDELRQLLREVQFECSIDQHGYISIQRFYIYAERGLARARVSIWLYEGRLQIAYREALLARYAYRYDRKQQKLRAVEQPQLYRTPFTDPQLELWELDDEQWRKVLERAPRLRRARDQRGGLVEQLPLWLTGLLVLVLSRIISTA